MTTKITDIKEFKLLYPDDFENPTDSYLVYGPNVSKTFSYYCDASLYCAQMNSIYQLGFTNGLLARNDIKLMNLD